MPSTSNRDIWKYVRERKYSREGRATMPFSLPALITHAYETFKTRARSESRRTDQKATQKFLSLQALRRTTLNNVRNLCSADDDKENLAKLANKVIKNLRNGTTAAQDNVQAQMLKHSPQE
jgi:hypothetical protein